ncbi:hypothetical protein B7939_00405 [Eggerthia catenaformis]|nr:hypothetical protein B7939_00405 [Eggerthia catenaformis]
MKVETNLKNFVFNEPLKMVMKQMLMDNNINIKDEETHYHRYAFLITYNDYNRCIEILLDDKFNNKNYVDTISHMDYEIFKPEFNDNRHVSKYNVDLLRKRRGR